MLTFEVKVMGGGEILLLKTYTMSSTTSASVLKETIARDIKFLHFQNAWKIDVRPIPYEVVVGTHTNIRHGDRTLLSSFSTR